jgi:hypothetical protein
MWRDAPRALRIEFLITILVIELLALATMTVLRNDRLSRPSPGAIND